MSDWALASPCERCLSPPERVDVPRGSLTKELPASVAWGGSRDAATSLLSTVVLSLAARSRVTLLVVSHRPGWASRLFGKSAAVAIHVAASDSTGGDEGAIEAKLLDAVTRKTGPKTPHGPSIRAAIEALFPSIVARPEYDILRAAKEDAVARGVGRWITKEERAPPDYAAAPDRLVEQLERSMLNYEILPAREAAVVSARRALEDLRSAFAARDPTLLSRLETEIERGLDDRTSKVD